MPRSGKFVVIDDETADDLLKLAPVPLPDLIDGLQGDPLIIEVLHSPGLGVHLRYWSPHCMPEIVRATQTSPGLLRRIANFNGLNFESRT